MSPWRLRQIAFQINSGALIAYPSDTLWGFGCHPLSWRTVNRIQSLKQRSPFKGLILLSSDLDLLYPYLDRSELQRRLKTLSQPAVKPVTWIIKASPDCPAWLTGESSSIAIRITDKPLIKQLCKTLQAPLVSTSANISGRATARNSLLVHKHFHSQVDIIIEGFYDVSRQASEIRDIQTGKILRS